MKFVYVDETGDKSQSDVFVMTGLLIDAYSLRKYTATFDKMITTFLKKHPNSPRELKAKEFINGSGDWSKLDAGERKEFLDEICDLAVQCATVYAIAFSFHNFEKAIDAGHGRTFGKSYCLGAAMFIAALVQKNMKRIKKNKGLTVFICDDNKWEMSNLSDALNVLS